MVVGAPISAPTTVVFDELIRLHAISNARLQPADFHLTMAAAAHNQVLLTIMRSIRELLQAGGRATENLHLHAEHELERHERLYEALRSRDADRVRHEILAHLATFLEEHRLSERIRDGEAEA